MVHNYIKKKNDFKWTTKDMINALKEIRQRASVRQTTIKYKSFSYFNSVPN